MYVLKSTICFIGMPGAGKTTLAGMLGKYFKLPVIDLDEIIEQRLGIPISVLWQAEGENTFRSIERFQLLKILAGKPVLLSAGGGTPCFFDNMNLINRFCFSVYLKTATPLLTDKMKSRSHPALQGNQNPELQWNLLLESRKYFYEQAQLIEDAYNIEPNVFEAVSKICLGNNIITRFNDFNTA